MLASLITDERQGFKIRFSDQALADFGPFDEALNLNFREASACAKTCSSEGFGCLAKAFLVAITFG